MTTRKLPAVKNHTTLVGDKKRSCLGNRKHALETVIPERRETHMAIPLTAPSLCLGEISLTTVIGARGEENTLLDLDCQNDMNLWSERQRRGSCAHRNTPDICMKITCKSLAKSGASIQERLCKNYLRSGAVELRDQSLLRHTEVPSQVERRRDVRKVVP